MYGYTGKILKIDLTANRMSIIPTEKYKTWGGGHGIGSAIFWDLVQDKSISGFDPENVVTIMTSPLSGTMAPSAGSRTEVQGIGVQSSPEWFTRSNFGGRFGAMLKYAGWDGIVIVGKANRPVWMDIRNSEVKIVDAKDLWGKDTWETQELIWQKVSGKGGFGDWLENNGFDQSTQRPAVLTIGPAGENLGRVGCLIHDAGNAAGQGGFGGVWGSKNLKAISVMGTGSVRIAYPKAFVSNRIKQSESHELVKPMVYWQRPEQSRPQACISCPAGCRSRYQSGEGNESNCVITEIFTQADLQKNSGFITRALALVAKALGRKDAERLVYDKLGKQKDTYRSADLLQKYGINGYEIYQGLPYIRDLFKMGKLGPGKEIDCDLPFDQYGSYEFNEKLLKMIAYRKGIGDDIAEGFYRAAKRWGRLKTDLETGLLPFPYWGLPEHSYDPRAQTEWGYGSILGDRDINEHAFNKLFWIASWRKWHFDDPKISAEDLVRIVSGKMLPYTDDPMMLDYSTKNIYSKHMARLVSWHRHYSRFWKQSVLYCDHHFPDWFDWHKPDKNGSTPHAEPAFFNDVTGDNISFTDGMKLGRKIWNLDNAIWTLQGRHRDMVHFAPYIYSKPYGGYIGFLPYYMPAKKDGKWDYYPTGNRVVDKKKFEAWKTEFYKLEGWDPETGWPTRGTLEPMNMGYVADRLEKDGRLGKS